MHMKSYWYKKNYKSLSYDKIYTFIVCMMLIFELNLTSHTLNVPNYITTILGLIIFGALIVVLFIYANNIYRDYQNGVCQIISDTSINSLNIVRHFSLLTLIPLGMSVGSMEDNIQLFWMLISSMAVIYFKSLFDFVVAFYDSEFISGLNKIHIHENMVLKYIKSKSHSDIKMINFEIYIDEKYKGYDLFSDSEYDYLMSISKKN